MELTLENPRIPVGRDLLERVADAVFDGEGRHLRVHVLVVGDEAMRELHARTMGEDTVTDVIAFDVAGGAAEEAADEDVDGEIVVNADLAAREAEERGHEPRAELLFYVAHGLLHLLGYDDASPEQRRAMLDRQAAYLRTAGLDVGT